MCCLTLVMASSGSDPTRTITATGTAITSAQADTLKFSWGVDIKRRSADEAFTVSEEAARKVLAALQAIGLEKNSVSIISVNSGILYEKQYEPQSPIVGFSCSRDYSVKLTGKYIELAEKATKTILKSGANTLGRLDWDLSDKAADALRLKSVADAVAVAKAKAETMAQQLGARVGPVIRIEEGIHMRRNDTTTAAARSMAHESQSISSMPTGNTSETASVTVVFELIRP